MAEKSLKVQFRQRRATARAVQRIPDAKCNGDMQTALAVAEELQRKQHQFMERLGVESLYRM